jgi:hypothetical protein
MSISVHVYVCQRVSACVCVYCVSEFVTARGCRLPDCPPITVRAPGEVSFSRLEQPSPLWILNESTDPSSFVLSGPPPRTHAHTDTRDGSVAVSDDDATPATLILRSGCDGCVIAS